MLLIPELLIKPARLARRAERQALIDCLGRLELVAIDAKLAELAAALGANYGLKPMDALHLATALQVSADMFVTNNRKDFDRAEILELHVV